MCDPVVSSRVCVKPIYIYIYIGNNQFNNQYKLVYMSRCQLCHIEQYQDGNGQLAVYRIYTLLVAFPLHTSRIRLYTCLNTCCWLVQTSPPVSRSSYHCTITPSVKLHGNVSRCLQLHIIVKFLLYLLFY